MNILCGVLSQTEGRVLIEGIDTRTHPEEAKKGSASSRRTRRFTWSKP